MAHEANYLSLARTALAFAWCGTADATPLVNELARRYPHSTMVNGMWLPEIRAAAELRRGHADAAFELLAPVQPYEAATEFWLQYLRGQAYLSLGKGTEAAGKFQNV